MILFSVSKLVLPVISPEMINDFSTVGGVIELATAMRIAGIKRDTQVSNLIPAMILVFPISAIALYFGF